MFFLGFFRTFCKEISKKVRFLNKTCFYFKKSRKSLEELKKKHNHFQQMLDQNQKD